MPLGSEGGIASGGRVSDRCRRVPFECDCGIKASSGSGLDDDTIATTWHGHSWLCWLAWFGFGAARLPA